MAPSRRELFVRAQMTLGLTHPAMAEMLGYSSRTMIRWAQGGGGPSEPDLLKLARAVYPRDAELADALAREAHTTLGELGVVPAAAVGAAGGAPRPAPTTEHLVDSIVCAASRAAGAAPEAVTAALRAAVTRARELGFSLEELEQALAPAAPAVSSKRARRATPER